ncbi:MAG: hypothetical protein KKD33_06250, partial [Verrucomicrobia bacterium]|nr:hypothetical protein [Verrucomicrobiota bacterium]
MNSLKGIMLITAILFCVCIGSGWGATGGIFTAEQFVYRELHDKGIFPGAAKKKARELLAEDRYDVKVALRSYKLAEDEDTETKKALAIKLNKQFVQKGDFWVLKTPRLGVLDIGTYRVTVRMKVQGMLSSLGSAVVIQAGNQTREVWMNEFPEVNVYREFSLDFDSRESDLITKRDAEQYFWRFGNVYLGGGVRLKEELPEIDEQLQRNEKPRLDRFSYWLAQHYLAGLTTNLPPENDPNRKAIVKSETQKFAAIIKQEILKSEGRALEFKKDAKDHPLPEQVVTWINQHGRLQPDGTVLIYFPLNITGKGVFKSSRGPTTPQPTLRLLTVDWIKIEKLPEPDNIVVREVDCRRAWCQPGETQIISTWLHNRSGKDQTNKFRLLLRTGLNREETLLEKNFTIKQGAYERLEWPWQIPTNQHLWGQTVVAQILKADQVVSEERTWFALHPSPVAVMIHDRANAARFLHPYAQRPPQVNNQAETLGSYCESQGVTPPKDKLWDPYVSSFGRAVHSMAGLYAVSKGLRQQGIAPFMYVCGGSMGAGELGFELFWEHPDWVQGIPANSDEFLLERRRTADLALKFYRGEYKTTNNAPPELSRSGGASAGELVTFNCLVDEVV